MISKKSVKGLLIFVEEIMTKKEFELIENYMLECMEDVAHDKEHVYRVLYSALDIAHHAGGKVDHDVLICACLLHDIGRKEECDNPEVNHAIVGAEKAYRFLIANGYSGIFAEKVQACISTHRYRVFNKPKSIEAKILFDADKLDTTGFMGIARTLLWCGRDNIPLYMLTDENKIVVYDEQNTFLRECKYKLSKLYDRFYTPYATSVAKEREMIAKACYHNLINELNFNYNNRKRLDSIFR